MQNISQGWEANAMDCKTCSVSWHCGERALADFGMDWPKWRNMRDGGLGRSSGSPDTKIVCRTMGLISQSAQDPEWDRPQQGGRCVDVDQITRSYPRYLSVLMMVRDGSWPTSGGIRNSLNLLPDYLHSSLQASDWLISVKSRHTPNRWLGISDLRLREFKNPTSYSSRSLPRETLLESAFKS